MQGPENATRQILSKKMLNLLGESIDRDFLCLEEKYFRIQFPEWVSGRNGKAKYIGKYPGAINFRFVVADMPLFASEESHRRAR